MTSRYSRPTTARVLLFALLLCLLAPIACQKSARTSFGGDATLILTGEDKTVCFATPLEDGGCFAVRFTHSVAKTPVEEWYCRQGRDLVLKKTVYQDFGAGLPHAPEPGQTMRFEGGSIVLDGFTRHMPSVTYRVGRVAHHELLLPHSLPIPLANFAKPGNALTFSIANACSTQAP